MAINKRFVINSKILNGSHRSESITMMQNGNITLSEGSSYGLFITNKLDSSEKGMQWGRLIINADFPDDCEFRVYIRSSDYTTFIYKDEQISYDKFFKDKNISDEEKLFILSDEKSTVIENVKDILLLNQYGRYLWFAVEIIGNVKKVSIDDIFVYFPGDSLIKYFPEIYKKNTDDFFQRYLAIFSSMNKDYQRKVDEMSNYVDIDKAPDRVLTLLASWVGINVQGGFLNDDQLRLLIKNSRILNSNKGTMATVSKVVELFMGEVPIIVEQFQFKKYVMPEQTALYEKLYGTSPYEFTIMLNQKLTEKIFAQLKMLVSMFKPARTKMTIIFLSQEMQFDKHCYTGINSVLSQNPVGVLAQHQYLDSNVILADK